MIRNYEDFCRELNNCGFSMGGGNAKGIFALIDYDWMNQDALDGETAEKIYREAGFRVAAVKQAGRASYKP